MISRSPTRLLTSILLIASLAGCDNAEAIIQPIQFNHELHVDENEMECSECHRSVERSRYAGRPGLQVCEGCHDVMLSDSEEERLVVEYVEAGREIPWRRLHRLNPSVFFSHARHVSAGDLQCQTCHGAMDARRTPPPSALMALDMNDCIDCHRTQQVRDDCNACHR